ncbi:Uncharacterised protein [Sphingobacterium spiritivorum]|uniref:Uncharacterized protein n=1 Tax=Sphingobacterium spiritivorum TaxID=258 RepID=A0A380BUD3_SPHSI|nr:hypothetical protein [Sphingobacterium spiritivorum]SUJ07179.1 Uncharacterised protein [Sphingobacterium spiritivorum]
MKIAILGWGSLIWSPKDLKYDKELNWNPNGPYLPIEFSRISQNGRLTLVIDSNAELVPTLYAISLYENLDKAISDLALREGCNKNKIGIYNKRTDKFTPSNFSYQNKIKEWINNTDLDAVVWTNLGKKFKDKIGLWYNSDNVIHYLETLPKETQIIAKEYITKTPKQIDTPIRKAIKINLGWDSTETQE